MFGGFSKLLGKTNFKYNHEIKHAITRPFPEPFLR
jgi:hypothetical protein